MAEEPVQRRLSAILAADIAGYSALMGADEARTVRDLKAHQAVVLPLVGEFGGRIIDTAGDGILAEFPSVVNAVHCAVSIQSKMAERNVAVEPERRMQFRIGINIGDIVYDQARIYGDGINVAARLEGIAEPGGICISNKVYEEINGRIALAYEDIGEQQLKNITRPVRAHRIRLNSVAPAWAPALALPDKPSIAVLPFRNMSGDPDQDYFADGMVEDIIAGLSRIKWLFVIARPSSFTYKGTAVNDKRVGRELGVRYLLQGSIRKDSRRVRITAQMIEAETAGNLWSERFDRSLDDVFALQDEIALNVVSAIEPSLRRAEVERVKRKRPESLDAYDLLLRAISFDMAMPDGVAKAMPILEQVLELEPDYARAHGHLSMCHHSLYLRGGLREENRLAAIRHAHAAIASGQDDSTALTLAGFAIGMDEHDRAAATQAFEAALALSPSSAFTYLIGSAVFGWGGDAERAIDWAERALRLSPLDPWNWFCCHGLALGHFSRTQYKEAVAAARKAIQLNPGFSMSHMLLAAALVKSGRPEEAKAAAARVLALQPTYKFGKHFASVDCAPALAAALGEALRTVGVPE